jgi:autotransporter-associated beta strand protein
LVFSAVAILGLAASPAWADSAVWVGATDATWADATGNWSNTPGAVPGTGNTATFNASAGVGGAVIDLGAGVTINTILFDTASAAAYTIGGGAVGSQTLILDDSGAVTMNATVASNELFNAGILLGTATAGTYTFTNNSTTNSLAFAGGVQGGTGGAGDAKTLTVTGAGNTAIGGILANGDASSLALTKDGAGILTLSGGNTFSGGVTLSAGKLILGNNTSLGGAAGTFTINNGTQLDVSAARTTPNNHPVTINGDFTYVGTNTLNLGTGAISLGDSGSAARTITVNASTLTLAGVISDGAVGNSLVKAGGGTLTLSGANTFTGEVNITGGAVRANNGTGLNTSSLLTLNGGVFETGANLERTGGSSAGNMQITGGTSGFSANGAAAQVAFGTLASPGALTWGTAPFAPDVLVLNASTANNTLNFTNAIDLGASARTVQVNANTATMSGILTGTGGGIIKTGSGTLVLSGNNTFTGGVTSNGGTLTLSGTQSFSGGIVMNGGTLSASSDTNLGAASGGITFNGTCTFGNDGNWTVGAGRTITVNAGANVTFNFGNATFAGPVVGSGTFTVSKPSQGNPGLSLTNTGNTFTGAMNLNDKGATGLASYTFNSLGDAPGAGIIKVGYGGQGADFIWGSGAIAPLVLNYRQVDFGGTTGSSIKNNNTASSHANTITVNTDLLVTGTGSRTLTLGGTNTGANTFAGKIPDGPSGTVISLAKADAGTWILSGVNTYTGATTITAGTLSIGASNNLGNGSATNTLVFNGGTLRIAGTALTQMSDLTNSSTRGITYTAAKLVGLNIADAANTFTVDQVLNQTTGGFTKSGAGTVVLNQANTYTGATAVSNGKLLLGQGGSVGATAVGVTNAATYGMSYTSSGNNIAGGASLSLAGGTTLNLQDGYTNTMSFTGAGSSALSGAGLYFDLGATTADKVELAGAATVTNTNTFYFNALGSLAAGTYTLITAASGLTGGTFAIGTTLPEYKLTLDPTDTAVYLNVALSIVPGDTNDDKVVDAADFITLKKNFGAGPGAAGKEAIGDFNASGTVNWADLGILMNNMGKTGGGAPATTPEPATLGLLAIGALAIVRRRRRS